MAKTVYNSFKNVFTYAAGIEKWCKDFYKEMGDKELEYTFPADFAIADWYGEGFPTFCFKQEINDELRSERADLKLISLRLFHRRK